MSENIEGFRELRATDHSLHLIGSVVVEDTLVHFRDEQPHEEASERYVFANGYTGTKESMALPRCVAAHAGYDARAMGASHNRLDHAISRYANEIVAVAGLENEQLDQANVEAVHLVGVSMGGAAVLRAALLCPKVATVTAEVPACVSDDSQLLDLLHGTPDRAKEMLRIIQEQPGFALRTALYSVLGTLRRPLGFLGEAIDLATEKVTEDIRSLQRMNKPPEIRIVVGDHDGLVRKRGVIQVANRLGVEVIVGDTGHVNGVLTDPQYTKKIIEMNKAA